jgi:hypothetical protein
MIIGIIVVLPTGSIALAPYSWLLAKELEDDQG